MRKQWKERYGSALADLDDGSRDGLASHDSRSDRSESRPRLDQGCELCGSQGIEFGDGLNPGFDFVSDQPDSNPPPGPVFLRANLKGNVKFVDASEHSLEATSARFEKVSAAAPPAVISEAVRLTDKKTLLYPWEKGRLGRIFGEQGRLNLKKPKLHPGTNNFVEVGVAVQEGFKFDASVSIRHPTSEQALYLSVVKNIVGCTYAEEREAQRDHVVRQWWDQLKLDMSASDPGRAAAAEHGLIEVYRYGLELLDAVFGLKSPNTLLKRLCAVKLYGQWVIRNYAEAWIPGDKSVELCFLLRSRYCFIST